MLKTCSVAVGCCKPNGGGSFGKKSGLQAVVGELETFAESSGVDCGSAVTAQGGDLRTSLPVGSEGESTAGAGGPL